MSKRLIRYGDHVIEFTVIRSDRKTLETRVHPDLSVTVRAPLKATDEKIMSIMEKRASWILKKQIYFTDFLPKEPPRKYVNGETHRYLGRQYRLKIISSEKNEVKLKGQYITIGSIHKDGRTYNEQLLYNWYHERAEKKYEEMLDSMMEKVGKYGVMKPDMIIKRMKRRWGSCSPEKNRINLNLELIRAPSHCIEYVIMHELCHLKYPHHDGKYYDFLSMVMPDWKERKGRLKEVHIC